MSGTAERLRGGACRAAAEVRVAATAAARTSPAPRTCVRASVSTGRVAGAAGVAPRARPVTAATSVANFDTCW
jgi:hypothetical protein